MRLGSRFKERLNKLFDKTCRKTTNTYGFVFTLSRHTTCVLLYCNRDRENDLSEYQTLQVILSLCVNVQMVHKERG